MFHASVLQLHDELTQTLFNLLCQMEGSEERALVYFEGERPDRTHIAHLIDIILSHRLRDTHDDQNIREALAEERLDSHIVNQNIDDMPAYEQAMRLIVTSGDRLERVLSGTFGAETAQSLREVAGGWPGTRNTSSGCDH